MRIITLEEHVSFQEFIDKASIHLHKTGKNSRPVTMEKWAALLDDVTQERLKSMDDNGISLQIVSVVGEGANLLPPKEAPAFAREYNDRVADRISRKPKRFAAFAHLPLTNPEASADELDRTVNAYGFKGALINGLTNDQFLDNPIFSPLLKKAEDLNTPIYLHPGLPPKAVADVYYSGLQNNAGQALGIAGWGWHSETALHVLRMIFSGTFDKFPRLTLIIGHMGEMLPMMVARIDAMFPVGTIGVNKRPVSQTLRDQVYITTSGIFTQGPLVLALETFGVDRILFSIDYPFSQNEQGIGFLDAIKLPNDQIEMIAHGNADRLFNL